MMSHEPFTQRLREHIATFEGLTEMSDAVQAAAAQAVHCLRAGGKVLLCGNGGSASDSQHIAAELVGRFVADRTPLSAIALSTDTSALTAIANDYGYREVFARQVQALGRAGDCLIGISTSGNSDNVLAAVRTAKALGIRTIGLTGRGGGALAQECEIALVVPSDVTARIQEAHIFIGHVLCEQIETDLGLATHVV